jgi:hypothetical protein
VVTPGSILIAGRNGIELDRLMPSQLLRRWALKNEGSVMSTKKTAADDKKATITTAPATPINAEAIQLPVAVAMGARRYWKSSSPNCWDF